MERGGCAYITTNKYNTTFYVGATSDLIARTIQHREKHYPDSFTASNNLSKLVWFESFSTIEEAIAREKYLKGKSRVYKIKLIKATNPDYKDLWEEIKEWGIETTLT